MSRVVAISGGVGGAKLALGLYAALPPHSVDVIVNTGDDFEHLGLMISPDVDTALYTLSGLSDPQKGWGRRDETWAFLTALKGIGGDTWFQLGDADLALHVERTRRLRAGEALGVIMQDIAGRLGIKARLLPMSNDPVRTLVDTDEGTLPFQDYFVRRRCEPVVRAIRFRGGQTARVLPDVLDALADPELRAIVICPSNPYLSVDPILSMPEMRAALIAAKAPVIAVTPVIGGKAVKGPTVKIMSELKLEVSAAAVARHYQGLIDGFVLDTEDAALAESFPVPVHVTNTLMKTLGDKKRVAQETLSFAERLRERSL